LSVDFLVVTLAAAFLEGVLAMVEQEGGGRIVRQA
jgi:hypothetical protein